MNEEYWNVMDEVFHPQKGFKRKVGIIKYPVVPIGFKISIPYTQNTPASAYANPVFRYTIQDKGALLYALALTWDTNTQNNYYMKLHIGTPGLNNVTDPNGQVSQFNPFPATQGYNPVPEGTALALTKGSQIILYVYNANSATVNGSVSVTMLLDNLALG
jgi:hypothetical protein